MKKLFFTIIISFLSLNMFAQNSQVDEFYKLTTDGKLNYLYNNMLDKHIKDFKKLEDEIKTLNFKLDKYKSSTVNLKNQELSNEVKEKNARLAELQKKFDSSKRLVNELENSNNKMLNNISDFKSQIKNEIKLITDFEGVIEPELIRSVERKANYYNIQTKNLSQLINVNQQIIKAENILSKPINESYVDNQYSSLEAIRSFPSDWHKYKISSLKQLLGNYCSITSDIFNAFIFLDNLGLDEHISSTRDDIENKRMLVINYPFLAKELDKKIKNIKYISKINSCN